MIHYGIGNAGQLFIIISFVTAILSSIAYFLDTNTNSITTSSWKVFGRVNFYLHAGSVLGIIVSLFTIIYNHYFEYQYAYSHSSRELPVQYIISCFWEGQEGSFLLWIFWNAVLGVILINTNKFWESPVMVAFAIVQTFLTSMILGVVLGDVKIGSTPFILMRDANIGAPIFASNPDYIPANGRGLNALLQNYWMVIHPPVLFLGFASTLIPFAYCMAGLWMKRFKEWVRPALPWTLFSGVVFGVGILMGGYWAYETLSFGGYWNWDPVENGSLIPWLIEIAAIHTMIIFRKNDKALKVSIILVVATFLLVLYSTFLNRSGILGNASVHSFTDLGLSGQLLIYLFFFAAISLFVIIKTWKKIPVNDQEVSAYSREFWIFIGAAVLCLSAFQILIPTSFPVINKIAEIFGTKLSLATPGDQVEFYNRFQIWGAVLIALLSGTGQFFWWQKMNKEQTINAMLLPVIATLIVSTIIILVLKVNEPKYIVLLTATVYSIIANFSILIKIVKASPTLSGGSVSHIGIALMLLGILFSSGYSNVISKNVSGFAYSKDFPEEMNNDNILLWLNKPQAMQAFEVTYKGKYLEIDGMPGYVDKDQVALTANDKSVLAKTDLLYNGQKYFSKGDSMALNPENTFYRIDYKKQNGEIFTLYPRAQINPAMGGLLASPDIKRSFAKDLYTHVYPSQNENKWDKTEEFEIGQQDTMVVNDFIAVLEKVDRVSTVKGIELGPRDAAVKATIKILDFEREYIAEPIFVIKNNMVGRIPDVLSDIGLKFTLMNIDPQTGSFKINVNTGQKDFVLMRAIEKPLINLLWLGTIIMVIGFIIAIYRRYREFAKMRNKGTEEL